MVLIQAWPPHLALAPIAQADPPFMPFRDAGYAPADFVLTIQDVVYGVWRAKEQKLIDIRSFNLEEYELYERVDQGDFNEIAPHFVAFASPQQSEYDVELNYPFQQVLDYFLTHDVQLVVRLNSHLYDKNEFEKRGIKHIDLVFEDGTCPTMEFVQAFIGAVEGVIAQKGKVAVHCKAGLGRTGCLIGAHLIYTHGFTAAEAIAYMRFLRPGMVVGPQQHWLYLHQNEFRDWRRTMTVSHTSSEKLAGFCPLVPRTSNSYLRRSPNSHQRSPPRTPERSILSEVDNTNSALPVPTPGQPRKNSPTPASRSSGNGVAGPRHGSPMAKRYVPTNIGQINSDEEHDDEQDDTFRPGSSQEESYDSTEIYNDAEEEVLTADTSNNNLSDETLDEQDIEEAEVAEFIERSPRSEQEEKDQLPHKTSIIEPETPKSPISPTSYNSGSRDNVLQVTKRTTRSATSNSNGGVLRSRSRRVSTANVTSAGSPERRKPSAASIVAEIFGDEENIDYCDAEGSMDDNIMVPKTKRNITDSLSQKQQMLMRRQLRSASNPSPQRVRTGGRVASFQMMTTTTTTTTTTTLSSSPPTMAAAAAAAGIDNGVIRRSSRIVSGVRKTSGGNGSRGKQR